MSIRIFQKSAYPKAAALLATLMVGQAAAADMTKVRLPSNSL